MDHATRHLSSPSPTSSFLFHHSEKNYKSSSDLLGPMLSSDAEDCDVNACLSEAAGANTSIENFSSSQSNEEVCSPYGHQNSGTEQTLSMNIRDDSEDESQPLILGQFGCINSMKSDALVIGHQICGGNNNEINHLGTTRLDSVKNCSDINNNNNQEDDEEDDDDDDDENMRNMLSSSSRSSATTMQLLTDTHNHSFSERISLEEYSPLSLVNDCDNALPMSPTSLACGSHHSSFKSSLKIDHLGVDGVGDVGGVNGVDDVVGDTRSMSPSLLSHPGSSQLNHNSMWSNSSTAIIQNPSILTSNSTSILLSQHSDQHTHHSHHHHQMSTLIQQLEPQSLDEPPPYMGINNGPSVSASEFASGNGHGSAVLLNRPSSEPPITKTNLGTMSLNEMQRNATNPSASTSTVKMIASSTSSGRTYRKQSSASSSTESTSLSKSKAAGSSSSSSTSSRSSCKSRAVRSRQRDTKINSIDQTNHQEENSLEAKQHSSKLHLQLTHHKKLKELQQRLFGNVESSANSTKDNSNGETKDVNSVTEEKSRPRDELSKVKVEVLAGDHNLKSESGDQRSTEADSSACQEMIAPESDTKQSSTSDSSANVNQSRPTLKSSRQTNRRRKLSNKNQSASHESTDQAASNDAAPAQRSTQRLVKTETAEPDTTTKTSDCLKLADLLTSDCSAESIRTNSNLGVTMNNEGGHINNYGQDRSIQHIQLQMNPSLTVVANNNGVMQPMTIQQHQLHLNSNNNNNYSISAGVNNQTPRQCQSNSTVSKLVAIDNTNGFISGAQLNCNIVPSGEVNNPHDGADSHKPNNSDEPGLILNWRMAMGQNSGNNNDNQCNLNGGDSKSIANQANNTSGTTIGAHQIAIQVICQDGTSLVLPVSSATNLNAAVSLSTQGQAQLQAILTNPNCNASLNCQQHQHRATGTQQIFPVVTMINNQSNLTSAVNQTNIASSKVSSPSGLNSTSTSGLAASSPTLAALLDAGSNRNLNLSTTTGSDIQGQNSIPGNLLRKFVTRSSIIQNSADNNGHGSSNNQVSLSDTSKTKKARLDPSNSEDTCNAINSQAVTFTLIDHQNLVVTNGNDAKANNTSGNQASVKAGDQAVPSRQEEIASRQAPSSNQAKDATTIRAQNFSGTINTNNNGSSTTKPASRSSSNTGNRPVDPTQPFRCEHCNSTFTRLGNFTRHKKIHTVPTKDGQRFKCDVCSKSFLQRCDLARHLHIHRGTEPHRCNICGKGYIRHSDLVTHQRFHNKEKPFGCPHCSKGFCQRGDLNRHLRSIHLQMKPILCPCCNRKFAKQETLLRHLNTAHRGANNKTVFAANAENQSVGAGESATNCNKKANRVEPNSSSEVVNENSDKTPEHQGAINNSSNHRNKSGSVASLQAIQATLCKVQSVDPSKKLKLLVSANDGPSSTAKAAT